MCTKMAKRVTVLVVLLMLALCLPVLGVAENQTFANHMTSRENETQDSLCWKPMLVAINGQYVDVADNTTITVPIGATVTLTAQDEYLGNKPHTFTYYWEFCENKIPTMLDVTGNTYTFTMGAGEYSVYCSTFLRFDDNPLGGEAMHGVHFRSERAEILFSIHTLPMQVGDGIPVAEGGTVTIPVNAYCADPTIEFGYYWALVEQDEDGVWIDVTELDETGPTLAIEATADMDGKYIYCEVYSVTGLANAPSAEFKLNVIPPVDMSETAVRSEFNLGENPEVVFDPYRLNKDYQEYLFDRFICDWDGDGTIEADEMNERVTIRWSGAELAEEPDMQFGNHSRLEQLEAIIDSPTEDCQVKLVLTNVYGDVFIYTEQLYCSYLYSKPVLVTVNGQTVEYENSSIEVPVGATVTLTVQDEYPGSKEHTYAYSWEARENGEQTELPVTGNTYTFTMGSGNYDVSCQTTLQFEDGPANGSSYHSLRFREERPDIILDVQTSHPVEDGVMNVYEGDMVTIAANPSCVDSTIEFASYWELAIYDESGMWIDGTELDETTPTLTFEATANMNGKFIYCEVYSVTGPADYAWFIYQLNVMSEAGAGETVEYRGSSDFNLGENMEIRFDPNSIFGDEREYLFDKFIRDWDEDGAIEADELNENISIAWSGAVFAGEPDTQFGNAEYYWVLEAYAIPPERNCQVKLVLTNKKTGDQFIYIKQFYCSYLYSKPMLVTVNGQTLEYDERAQNIKVPAGATVTVTAQDEYLGSREHTYVYAWEVNGDELEVTGDTYTFTMGSGKYSVGCQTTLQFATGLADASSQHTLHFSEECPDIILDVQTSHPVEDGMLSVTEGDLVTIATNPSCSDSTIELNHYWDIGIFDPASLRYDCTVFDEEGPTLTFEVTSEMNGALIYGEVYGNGANYAWFQYTLNVLPAADLPETMEKGVRYEFNLGENPEIDFNPNLFYGDYQEYLFDKFIYDWDGNGKIEADELNEHISIEWSGVDFVGEPDTQFGNQNRPEQLAAVVDSPTDDCEAKLVLTNTETGDRFIYTYDLDCTYLYSKPVLVSVNGQDLGDCEHTSVEIPVGATVTLTVQDEYTGSREHTYDYEWVVYENGVRTEPAVTGNTYTFTMNTGDYTISCYTTLQFENGPANGSSFHTIFVRSERPDVVLDVQISHPVEDISHPFLDGVICVTEGDTVTIATNPTCEDPKIEFFGYWEFSTYDEYGQFIDYTVMDETSPTLTFVATADMNGQYIYGEIYAEEALVDYECVDYMLNVLPAAETGETYEWEWSLYYREGDTIEFWFEPHSFSYAEQFLNDHFFFDWDGNGTIETDELNENIAIEWSGAECTEADTAFGSRGSEQPFALRAAIESATSINDRCEVILTLTNKENGNAFVITYVPEYRPLIDVKPTVEVDGVVVEYEEDQLIAVARGETVSITANAYYAGTEAYTCQYKWNTIAPGDSEWTEHECTGKTFTFTMENVCNIESVVYLYDANGDYVDEIHHYILLEHRSTSFTVDVETSHPVDANEVMTVTEGDTVSIATICTDPKFERYNYWSFDIYDENGEMIDMIEQDETGPTLTFVATAEMNGYHVYGEAFGIEDGVIKGVFILDYTLNVVPAASTGETVEYRVRSEFNLGENPEIRFDPNSFYDDYRDFLFDKFICDWDGDGAIEADELNERISIEWSGVDFVGEPDTQFGNGEYYWVLEAVVDPPAEDCQVKLALTNNETGDTFIYTYELDCSYLYSKPVLVTVNGQNVAYETTSIEVPTGATVTLTVQDEYPGSREHTYAYSWEARENGEQTELPVTGNTYTFTMGSGRYSVSCQTTLRFEDGPANASSYHTLHFTEERPDIILNVQTSHPVEDGVLSVTEGDLVTIAANPACSNPTIQFTNYWEIGIFDAASLRYESTVLDEEGPTLTFEATADMNGGYIYYEVYGSGADYAWFEYQLNVLPAEYSIELSEHLLELNAGDSAALEAVLTPAAGASIQWSSSNPAVAQVDQNGRIQALAAGTAVISASFGEKASAECQVVVHSASALVLPEKLQRVDASSFVNVAAEEIVLPQTLRQVGEQAFAGNNRLKLVVIPGVDTVIEQGAFANCPNVTFLCSENSMAMAYAQAEGIPYIVMD